MAGNFKDAIQFYTVAIEITVDTPNAIYFANRANAYLELLNFEECIADCNMAISIDKSFPKSYYRKSRALASKDKLVDAFDTINKAIELDPDNTDYKKYAEMLAEEIEIENRIP